MKNMRLVSFVLVLVIVSISCKMFTGLLNGETTQQEDVPEGFLAQADGFSAESTTEGSVLLNWEPISGAEQYLIEVQIGDEFVALATLPADQASYEDSNVPPATRFTYRLSSLVSAKPGDSKEITVETPQEVSNPLQVSIEFDQTSAAIDLNNFDPNSFDPNTFDPSSIDPENFDPSMYMAQPIQTEAVLGPQGGEISVTGSNGVIYTLSVPPDALRFEVTITLRPISAIPDLPLSGGLMAAVFVEPESLVFDIPATLEMTLPADFPAAAGPLVMAFAFESEGQEFHLYPFAAAGGQSSVGSHLASLQAVPNFDESPKIKPVRTGGGYGKGSGTAKDAKEIGRNPSSRSLNRTEQRLAVSQLEELAPIQSDAVIAFGIEGESILQKAGQVDDMGKLMQALDDFSSYLIVGGDKYEFTKKLNNKILDLLVDKVKKLLDKIEGSCLTEDDLKAQELIERLTKPKDSFSKTFAERFKQKHGQQVLDDLAKGKITCSFELTMNSTITFETDGSTLHTTAKVSQMKLFPTYSKGNIYLSGEGDMKQDYQVSGVCSFPLTHYDNLKFSVGRLTPIFIEDVVSDFILNEYAVKGWDGSVNVSLKEDGKGCPSMVNVDGGGDYWTGAFILTRFSLGNQSITGWDAHNYRTDSGSFHSLEATWESVNENFTLVGVKDSKSSEDTKFKLKVTKNSK